MTVIQLSEWEWKFKTQINERRPQESEEADTVLGQWKKEMEEKTSEKQTGQKDREDKINSCGLKLQIWRSYRAEWSMQGEKYTPFSSKKPPL